MCRQQRRQTGLRVCWLWSGSRCTTCKYMSCPDWVRKCRIGVSVEPIGWDSGSRLLTGLSIAGAVACTLPSLTESYVWFWPLSLAKPFFIDYNVLCLRTGGLEGLASMAGSPCLVLALRTICGEVKMRYDLLTACLRQVRVFQAYHRVELGLHQSDMHDCRRVLALEWSKGQTNTVPSVALHLENTSEHLGKAVLYSAMALKERQIQAATAPWANSNRLIEAFYTKVLRTQRVRRTNKLLICPIRRRC